MQDPALTDFDFIQPGHFGWNSVEAEVAVLNMRHGRSDATKPMVVAETGYEKLAATNFEDIQRAAFWLAMLNGAAGYSYGAAPTFEANSADMPFQRHGRFSLQTWEEGMAFPGSQQVGMAAKFLKSLDWSRFEPRPDWVTPRGTTLLDARNRIDIGSWLPWFFSKDESYVTLDWPTGEWQARGGNARAPYAAGAPRGTRVIYIPSFGLRAHFPLPTVLKLDPNVPYQAYFWDPVLGTSVRPKLEPALAGRARARAARDRYRPIVALRPAISRGSDRPGMRRSMLNVANTRVTSTTTSAMSAGRDTRSTGS